MAYGMCRFAFFVALISLCASCGRKQIAQPYTSFSQSPETDSLFQGRDGSGETSPKKSQKKTTDQKTVSEERVQQNNFLANLELARRIDVPVPVNYSLVFPKKMKALIRVLFHIKAICLPINYVTFICEKWNG